MASTSRTALKSLLALPRACSASLRSFSKCTFKPLYRRRWSARPSFPACTWRRQVFGELVGTISMVPPLPCLRTASTNISATAAKTVRPSGLAFLRGRLSARTVRHCSRFAAKDDFARVLSNVGEREGQRATLLSAEASPQRRRDHLSEAIKRWKIVRTAISLLRYLKARHRFGQILATDVDNSRRTSSRSCHGSKTSSAARPPDRVIEVEPTMRNLDQASVHRA